MIRPFRCRSALAIATTFVAVVLMPLHACLGRWDASDPCGRVCRTGHLQPAPLPGDSGQPHHQKDCPGCTLALGVPVLLALPVVSVPVPVGARLISPRLLPSRTLTGDLPDSRGPPLA